MNKLFATTLATVVSIGAMSLLTETTTASENVGVVGGVVRVEVPPSTESVRFMGKAQLLFEGYGYLAIPLSVKPGFYRFEAMGTAGPIAHGTVEVSAKEYPKEYITLEDEEQVTPSPETLERIGREIKIMRAAYQLLSDQPTDLAPILLPSEGRKSGIFGSQRFFNGKPRNPHSGMDVAAPVGTPIRNPVPGRVVVTGHFFFNGKTVMIDHGGGFVSMFCHMNDIHVKEGQLLDRGAVLGTIGTTGRSTGPHVHWSTSLQGERVDPEELMRVVNDAFDDESGSGDG